MIIDKNFWQIVEQKLDYVLYGDSVSENSKIVVKFDDQLKYLKFNDLWNYLIQNGYIVENIENKEYIFLDNKLSILSYDIKEDKIKLLSPKYIMRHYFDGELIRLNLTNYTYIDITANHSLIGYKDFKLEKISPIDANYVAVNRNNLNIDNFKYDLDFLLFGLWISNGTLYKSKSKQLQYPGFSFFHKKRIIDFITEQDSDHKIQRIYDKTDYDFHIDYPKFLNFLKEYGYENLNSPKRKIDKITFDYLKTDLNSALSFIIGYYIGDGSYSTNLICFSTDSEQLALNIVELLAIYGIYSHIVKDINGCNYKGNMKGDMFTIKVAGCPPNLLTLLKSIESLKNHTMIKEYGTYFGQGESPLNNGSIVRKKENAHIHCIKPVKIKSKSNVKYDGYVYDFEVPETHNFIIDGVLVHNTDSIFVYMPHIDGNNLDISIPKSAEIAKNINGILRNYLNSTILPKLNIDPKYNYTDFKTEFTCNALMLLDIKKNYAFKTTSLNGKPHTSVEYTGLPIVKSNSSEFGKEILKDIIEKIVLNTTLSKTDMISALTQLATEKNQYLKQQVENGNFKYFATPIKWADTEYTSEPANVISMKLYNTLIGDEVFRPLSSGLQIPIIIKNSQLIKNINTNNNPLMIDSGHFNKLNFITVPYNYDRELVLKLFNDFSISIIPNLWEKLLEGAILQKVISVIKEHVRTP